MARHSTYALAALACAAVHGLEPVNARLVQTASDDVDIAVVHDNLQRQWLVRAPRTPAAGLKMQQEGQLVETLMSWLPFALPQVEGTATLAGGGQAVVHRQLPGRELQIGELTLRKGLATGLGQAIAAVHELPTRLVEEAGLPVYGTEEYRFRRLAEIDRAASTGKVPQGLLTRWETAIEEVGAWRFVPCVVHGDLAPENVLVDGGEVVGVVEWSEARVADPADDLAWLTLGAAEPALEAVAAAYSAARREAPDRDLRRRARLAGELAIARWLLHGVSTDDASVVDDAVLMLTHLDATVADRPW